MKTITKISRQQNGERYNLFLDEEFFCGVSEDTLIKLKLKKGMQLDDELLDKLTKEESKSKCFSYALYLLGRQNYFEKVLRDKLKRKEFTAEEIDATITKLRQFHYLDDARLAEAFVNDKKRFSKKGPLYIAQALRLKGVGGEVIQNLIEENYGDSEQVANCKGIAEKKWEYYERKTSDAYTLKGKMYAFLAQRGFSSDVIRKTLEEIEDERNEKGL